MRKRILIPPISALIIVMLCAYKLTRTYEPSAGGAAVAELKRPAPLFELYNQSKPHELARLFSYVGRHQILIVFFDGKRGADKDPTLLGLRREFDKIKAAGTIVLAISEALPQQNRKIIALSGPFPFPLLSDPDFRVHRAWGRFDETTGQPTQGLFLIDRAGQVAWSQDGPMPAVNPRQAIDRLIEGG